MIKAKNIRGTAKVYPEQRHFSKSVGLYFGRSTVNRSSLKSSKQKTFSYRVIDPEMVMSSGQAARALVADVGQVGAFSQPIKSLIKRLVNTKQLWRANVNTLAVIISLTGKFYENLVVDQIRARQNGFMHTSNEMTEAELESEYNEEPVLSPYEESEEEEERIVERIETAAILARTFFTFLFSSVMSVIIKKEMLKAGISGPVTAKQAFAIVNRTIARMGLVRFLSRESRPYFKDLRFVFALYIASSGAEQDLLRKPENLMRFYRGQMFYTRFIDEIVNLIVEERTAKVAEKQNSKNMDRRTYTNPILSSYYDEEIQDDVEIVGVDEDFENEYEQRVKDEGLEEFDEDIIDEIEDLEEEIEKEYEDEEMYEQSVEDDDEEIEEIVSEIEEYEEDYVDEDYETEQMLPQEMTDEEFAESFEEIEPRREAYVYASRLLSERRRFYSSRALVNRIVEDLSRYFSEEEKEEAKESLQVVVDRAEAQGLIDDLKELVAKLAELLLKEEELKVAEQRVEDEEDEEETAWWDVEDAEESEEEEEEEEEENEEEAEESEEEGESEEESEEEEERLQSRRGYLFGRPRMYAKKQMKRKSYFADDEDSEEETETKSKYTKKVKSKRYNQPVAPTRDNDAMDEVKRNLRKSKLEYQKSIRRELKDRKRYMQIPDEDKYIKPSKKR